MFPAPVLVCTINSLANPGSDVPFLPTPFKRRQAKQLTIPYSIISINFESRFGLPLFRGVILAGSSIALGGVIIAGSHVAGLGLATLSSSSLLTLAAAPPSPSAVSPRRGSAVSEPRPASATSCILTLRAPLSPPAPASLRLVMLPVPWRRVSEWPPMNPPPDFSPTEPDLGRLLMERDLARGLCRRDFSQFLTRVEGESVADSGERSWEVAAAA